MNRSRETEEGKKKVCQRLVRLGSLGVSTCPSCFSTSVPSTPSLPPILAMSTSLASSATRNVLQKVRLNPTWLLFFFSLCWFSFHFFFVAPPAPMTPAWAVSSLSPLLLTRRISFSSDSRIWCTDQEATSHPYTLAIDFRQPTLNISPSRPSPDCTRANSCETCSGP